MCMGNCNGSGMKFHSKSNSMAGAGRNPFTTKGSMPKGWNVPTGGTIKVGSTMGGFGTPSVRMSFSGRRS